MEDNNNVSGQSGYKAGDIFGVYWLVEELGPNTFKAKHHDKEINFVIKLYKESSETAKKLYDDEVKAYRQLEDIPGVLDIRDDGLLNGYYFIVTDFIGSGTLRKIIIESSNESDVSKLLRLFTQIANTLDRIHNRGIVHKDIKPENILLNKLQDNYYQTFVVDFGFARKTDVTGSYPITDFYGSVDYYAPEEWTPHTLKTKAVDIYAFGIMLYEALEGKHPFPIRAKTPEDVKNRSVPDANRIKEIANEETVNAILKSLKYDPAERSASVREIVDDISKSLNIPYPDSRHFIGHQYKKRYIVVDIVGMGMASISLLACDCEKNKLVVLKVFSNTLIVPKMDAAKAFRKEMKNLDKLKPDNGESFPGILLSTDNFTEKDSFFIVTDYQAGGNLRDLLDSKPDKKLLLEETIEIFTPIAKAIEYIHGQDVIHRDLKPENIVYSESKDKKIFFIIDFGISGILDGTKLVLSSKIFGSRPYFAPELNSESPEIKKPKALDIYAFGTMLYEALEGKISGNYDDLDKIPGRLQGLEAGVLIQKARSPNPDDRPKSAIEIIQALKEARPITQPVEPANRSNPHTPLTEPKPIPEKKDPPPQNWRKYVRWGGGRRHYFAWVNLVNIFSDRPRTRPI